MQILGLVHRITGRRGSHNFLHGAEWQTSCSHRRTNFYNWTIHWFCVLWTMYKFNWLRENAGFPMFIAWISMADTIVKIRVEGAFEACCILSRLRQFSICRVCLNCPFDWGWRFSNGLLLPLWHSSEVNINSDSLTTTCGCSSQKYIKCKCTTFSCIPFCKCQRNCVYKSV